MSSNHCLTTNLFRPMSSVHDLMQLMGRGGRGPNVEESSLEVIWNNSDLSTNVPGSEKSSLEL